MDKDIKETFELMVKIDFLYDKLARKYNTTDAIVRILTFLEDKDNISQKDISDQLVMPKQTVNNILTNFKNEGYINLVSVVGKKIKIIKTTPKGKLYFGDILNKIYEVEKNVYNSIGEDKFKEIKSNLEAYYESLKSEVNKNE